MGVFEDAVDREIDRHFQIMQEQSEMEASLLLYPQRPIHQSEVVTLGRCERQWYYRYREEKLPETPSQAMVKGTLWHAYQEEWWRTPGGLENVDWANVLENMGDAAEHLTQDVAEDVLWMAERYEQWRDGDKDTNGEWEMVGQEIEVEVSVAGLRLAGRFDGLARSRFTGDLYLVERKTMRDWRRLDYLDVDPQLSHYLLMAREVDPNIVGVLYEAAKTYRWKRDEHPPSDSFQEHLVFRSPEQLDAYQDQYLRAFKRRVEYISVPSYAIPNIGQTCAGCDFKDRCWGSMKMAEDELQWEE